MNKLELSAYLCTLHTLMQAIDPTPVWLADEYNTHWDQFKQAIKENTNEGNRLRTRTNTDVGNGEGLHDRRDDVIDQR